MVQTGPDYTNQLSTEVDGFHPRTLVVTMIPFLGALLHLGGIVGSEGKTLETTTSCNRTGGDKVLEHQGCHVPYQHAAGLGGSVDL